MVAAKDACAVDAVGRLIHRASGSWIACGTTRDALDEVYGHPLAAALISAAAEVVELPARPGTTWAAEHPQSQW